MYSSGYQIKAKDCIFAQNLKYEDALDKPDVIGQTPQSCSEMRQEKLCQVRKSEPVARVSMADEYEGQMESQIVLSFVCVPGI
jgi:hypothetical protein